MSERIWHWWRNLFPQRVVYAHWAGEEMCLHDAIRDADNMYVVNLPIQGKCFQKPLEEEG